MGKGILLTPTHPQYIFLLFFLWMFRNYFFFLFLLHIIIVFLILLLTWPDCRFKEKGRYLFDCTNMYMHIIHIPHSRLKKIISLLLLTKKRRIKCFSTFTKKKKWYIFSTLLAWENITTHLICHLKLLIIIGNLFVTIHIHFS